MVHGMVGDESGEKQWRDDDSRRSGQGWIGLMLSFGEEGLMDRS